MDWWHLGTNARFGLCSSSSESIYATTHTCFTLGRSRSSPNANNPGSAVALSIRSATARPCALFPKIMNCSILVSWSILPAECGPTLAGARTKRREVRKRCDRPGTPRSRPDQEQHAAGWNEVKDSFGCGAGSAFSPTCCGVHRHCAG